MRSWIMYLAGLAWASIFGLSFLVTKGALEALSPLELLALRFILASAALAALRLAGLVKLGYRGKPRGRLALLCLFQPVLYFLFETYGIRGTATSTAGLICGALPAVVAALSAPLLKERLSPRQVVGLAASIAGVAVIVVSGDSSGGSDSGLGIALMLCAVLSAAFYNILSRQARAVYSPAEITFAMMCSGAAFFGVLAVVEGALKGGPSVFERATPAAWGAVAYLGVLSSVVAFFLVNLSLSRLPAARAIVFATVTTLVSLVAGVLVRGERFGLLELGGAAAIMAGVWATNARGSTGSVGDPGSTGAGGPASGASGASAP